jgi:hypothetical protein
MSDVKRPKVIVENPLLDDRKISIEAPSLGLPKPTRTVAHLKLLSARITSDSVSGFARGLIHPAYWLAMAMLICATAPCERAYAMNDRADLPRPEFLQEVDVKWWSATNPNGKEFELPSGTKTCSLLKAASWAGVLGGCACRAWLSGQRELCCRR